VVSINKNDKKCFIKKIKMNYNPQNDKGFKELDEVILYDIDDSYTEDRLFNNFLGDYKDEDDTEKLSNFVFDKKENEEENEYTEDTKNNNYKKDFFDQYLKLKRKTKDPLLNNYPPFLNGYGSKRKL
jgi:hypothetical protein